MIDRAGRVLLWMGVWSLPALLGVGLSRGVALAEESAPGRALSTELLLQLTSWWIWALLSPAVFRISGRLRPRAGDRARPLLAHLVLAVAFVALHGAIFVSVLRVAGFFPPDATIARAYGVILSQTGPFQLVLYAGIAVAGVGYRLLEVSRERELRASRLEAQLSRARLDALRMQLHPHFLFNALNTLAMRVRRGANREALDLLLGFSELLRLLLQRERTLVPLEEELDLARRYLAIEKARFGERLRYRVGAEEGARTAVVPALLLQPLLENALRHGVARSETPVSVRVEARRSGDRVRIVVADDGPLLPHGWSPGSDAGIGLRNTVERLRVAYGDEAELDLENREGEVRATVVVPHRPALEEEAGGEPGGRIEAGAS